MDLIPISVDGCVVLDVTNICKYEGNDCRWCPDLAVAIHNWCVGAEVNYLIIDFQDEKDICQTFLAELLQLQKRLDFPFLFIGVMEKVGAFLRSYAYDEEPFFSTPEEGVFYLKKHNSSFLSGDHSRVEFGQPIPCASSRQNRFDFSYVEGEASSSGL